MLKIPKLAFEPVRKVLQSDPSGETYVVIKPATMVEEARRLQILSEMEQPVLNIHVLATELYLTLQECNILGEDEKPFLDTNLSLEEFIERLTALWRFNPAVIQELQETVYQANPQWRPEGNP